MDTKKSWWLTLPAWSKVDELYDNGTDDYILSPVLKDTLTEVERENNDYILYGPEEALLFRPKKLIPRLGMELYFRMMQVFKHN